LSEYSQPGVPVFVDREEPNYPANNRKHAIVSAIVHWCGAKAETFRGSKLDARSNKADAFAANKIRPGAQVAHSPSKYSVLSSKSSR
jgi:hypothetical protein